MSVAEFQRALAYMALDDHFIRQIRENGPSALSDYDINPREKQRILDVAGQPGVGLVCSLGRANRFTPIAEAFPLTCELLKARLRSLLDDFWINHRPQNYQLTGEDLAFADYLRQRQNSGDDLSPYLDDVLAYETKSLEIARQYVESGSDDGCHRVLNFSHDPAILLQSLENQRQPPPDLAKGRYPVSIRLRNEVLEVDLLET